MTTLLCLPGKDLDKIHVPPHTLSIGVDSGADNALDYGIECSMIVGDLDSVNRTRHINAEFIELPSQEKNDLEKALDFCLDRGWTDIMIIGMRGGRPDMEMANIAAVMAADASLQIQMLHPGMLALRVNSLNPLDMIAPIGTQVSIFTNTLTVVQTSGLEWDIDGVLEPGSRGVSNLTKEANFTIEGESNTLVFIGNNQPSNGTQDA
ncbi:MAG TPA: thiamine diphosphokinase [Candidatus Thalassarchaeaceae archaeon]|nr:thiamine diphosphokinase [Candidatus Thalassarchaeaceae archaeon]